jgi:light-regulated signal transduction histidine kinase (bacteriophytochrome)
MVYEGKNYSLKLQEYYFCNEIDNIPLAQVFQYLVIKEIKLNNEETPKIHIPAERNVIEWIFSVKDNGIESTHNIRRKSLKFLSNCIKRKYILEQV